MNRYDQVDYNKINSAPLRHILSICTRIINEYNDLDSSELKHYINRYTYEESCSISGKTVSGTRGMYKNNRDKTTVEAVKYSGHNVFETLHVIYYENYTVLNKILNSEWSDVLQKFKEDNIVIRTGDTGKNLDPGDWVVAKEDGSLLVLRDNEFHRNYTFL